jgi:hypothetical protein
MTPKAAGKAPAGKAPAAKKTVASKKKATPKKIAPAGGPARKKKRVENWSSYIYKGTSCPSYPSRQMVVLEMLSPPGGNRNANQC